MNCIHPQLLEIRRQLLRLALEVSVVICSEYLYFDMELQVVKNVASQTLEVKKLVYLYLLHYAEKYGIFRILVSES